MLGISSFLLLLLNTIFDRNTNITVLILVYYTFYITVTMTAAWLKVDLLIGFYNFQLLDTLPVCQDFNRNLCNRPACKFVHLQEGECGVGFECIYLNVRHDCSQERAWKWWITVWRCAEMRPRASVRGLCVNTTTSRYPCHRPQWWQQSLLRLPHRSPFSTSRNVPS